MKYIKTMLGLAVAALLTTTAMAANTNAITAPDLWRMSVAGAGTIQTDGASDAAIGVTLSLAREVQMVIPSELGVRQGIGWANTDKDSSTWGLSTTVFNDWRIIRVGNVELLAGGRIGATYGNTPLTWTGGPEVEARLWMKDDVYTFVRAAYDFNIAGNGFTSQDAVNLQIGVGFSF